MSFENSELVAIGGRGGTGVAVAAAIATTPELPLPKAEHLLCQALF